MCSLLKLNKLFKMNFENKVEVDTPIVERLIRDEVMIAAHSRLGVPVKIPGVSSAVLSAFVFIFFICGIIFLFNMQYARKETVFGQVIVIDGAPRITSSRSGVVEAVHVSEGEFVKTGEKLISISSTPKLDGGMSLANGLMNNYSEQALALDRQVSTKVEQINRQRDEIVVRLQGIDGDIQRLIRARELQEDRVKIQETIVEAIHKLGDQGLVAKVQVGLKDEELISSRQILLSKDRELMQQRSAAAQLEATLARLKSDEKLIRSEGKYTNIQFKEKELNLQGAYADHIVSPVSGILTGLQVNIGTSINPNQTLAIVVPIENKDSHQEAIGLEVELWAPSRAIGFLKKGAEVRLMYDSFPYQKFGVGHGKVRDVSLTPVSPKEQVIKNSGEDLYRIRVTLVRGSLSAYGKDWLLRPGMALTADIVLEERSLLDWLLEPMFAIKNRSE